MWLRFLYRLFVLLLLVVVFIVAVRGLAVLIFFSKYGLAGYFWKLLFLKYSTEITAFLFAFSFLSFNLILSLRFSLRRNISVPFQRLSPSLIIKVALLLSAVVAFIFCVGERGLWIKFLNFQCSLKEGILDPVFGKDVSFYLMRLPFLNWFASWMFWLVATGLALVVVFYLFFGITGVGTIHISHKGVYHMAVLLNVALLVLAWKIYLGGISSVFKVFSQGFLRYKVLLWSSRALVLSVLISMVFVILFALKLRKVFLFVVPVLPLFTWIVGYGVLPLTLGSKRQSQEFRETVKKFTYYACNFSPRSVPVNISAASLKSYFSFVESVEEIQVWPDENMKRIFSNMFGKKKKVFRVVKYETEEETLIGMPFVFDSELSVFPLNKTALDGYPVFYSVPASYKKATIIPLKGMWERLIFSFYNLHPALLWKKEPRGRIFPSFYKKAKALFPFFEVSSSPYVLVTKQGIWFAFDVFSTGKRFPFSEWGKLTGEPLNYRRLVMRVFFDQNGDYYIKIEDPAELKLRFYKTIFQKLFSKRATHQLFNLLPFPQEFFEKTCRVLLEFEARGSYLCGEPTYFIQDGKIKIATCACLSSSNSLSIVISVDPSGKPIVYRVSPKAKVYGPRQVSVVLDQEPAVKTRLKAVKKRGYKILKEQVFVIPSIYGPFYFKPYFRLEKEVPVLFMTAVWWNGKVGVGKTPREALLSIPVERGRAQFSLLELIRQAYKLYKYSLQALKNADWETYGKLQKELGELLEKMYMLSRQR